MAQISLQDYVNYLQWQIDTGRVDGNLPVAHCKACYPFKTHSLPIKLESLEIIEYGGRAIIRH